VTVVATAGHVDHGKSTLVQALTGVDPDRFAEEKERGMTLDLGFATVTLPSGRLAEFVDVPGHSRYLKNMLSGVGSVAACVFVVAATEGWKAQSEEHLRILDLLAVPRGMVALTKAELAGPELTALASDEIADRIRGTFLEGAEIVPVDVPAGSGVDAIQAALDRLLATVPTPTDRARPRLWIDRSFAIKGAGCVITGTLTGGSLMVGQALAVEPGGLSARVKALQVNHEPVNRTEPGHRVAVNLAGVSHHDIERGQALVEPGRWHVTPSFDASLQVLDAWPAPLTSRGAFGASIGSGEHPVRIRLLGGGRSIEPGETGFIRARFIGATGRSLLPGDRYVLREAGRSALIGGGEILDVAPVLPRRKAAPTRSVQRVVEERGWVAPDERRVLKALEGELFQPPDLPLSDRGALRSLERQGQAFESDCIWFSASAVKGAVEALRPMLTGSGATVSDARQALGTTRKYALPLLKYLDSRGITRRHEDRRTAGPRISSYG
jgi:selenocysteine-specific elongation factor